MNPPAPLSIREVLCATDFSIHSEAALRAAFALARHFRARLHLLHVIHHPPDAPGSRARLEDLARGEGSGLTCRVAVSVGAAAIEIVRYAEHEGIDLVVVGTHGRTGLSHVLVGSVAEAVIRKAPCQVLTIRRIPERPVPAPIEARPHVPAHPMIAGRIPGEEPRRERPCLVCAAISDEVICPSCKTKIQVEVMQRKMDGQRPGRMPA